MFFILSKIFEFFLAPTHCAIFLGALGSALLYTRAARWGRRLAAISAVVLLAMAFGPVGNFLAAPLEARFPPPPGDMPAPDGIIVLGGSVDDKLSADLNRTVIVDAPERLTAPIVLRRKYPNARIIFTGGSAALRGGDYSEAQAVQRFWRDVGLDTGDILYEARSRNTHENALYTRELAQPKPGERWLLITSAMHMPRSVGIFRQVGFPVIAYPVDFRTKGNMWRLIMPRFATKALGLVDFAAHEWAGLVAYRLTGKTDALFPAP